MKASASSESPEGDSDEYQVPEFLHKIKQRCLAGVVCRGLRRISYQDTKKKAFIQELCTPQGIKQLSPLKGDYAVAEIRCLAGVARRGLRRISYLRYEKNDTCAIALHTTGNKTAQSPKGRLRGGGMKASASSESPEGDSGEYQVSEFLHKIKRRCLAGVARRGLRRISYQDTKKEAFIQELCTPQGIKQRSPLKGDYAVAEKNIAVLSPAGNSGTAKAFYSLVQVFYNQSQDSFLGKKRSPVVDSVTKNYQGLFPGSIFFFAGRCCI